MTPGDAGIAAAAMEAALEAQANAHDLRVSELLAANNAEVERRRAAEAALEPLRAEIALQAKQLAGAAERAQRLRALVARWRDDATAARNRLRVLADVIEFYAEIGGTRAAQAVADLGDLLPERREGRAQ